jgi:CTP:molybdopterin cytidylyltransferase MocA
MSHPTRVRKAVFPVAGLGTRFLPATKASPKEMLPVVDKPLIQYAVEEAYEAGIRDMIFVTGRSPRVTGAQRMALAGVSEWRIQVFGRWGSSAVLRCIRDTLVAVEWADIAKTVELAQPLPLHRILSSVQPGTPLAIQDRALEQLHRLPATPVEGSHLSAELLTTIANLQSELAAVSARTYTGRVQGQRDRPPHG